MQNNKGILLVNQEGKNINPLQPMQKYKAKCSGRNLPGPNTPIKVMPLLFCILGGGIIYTLGMIPFSILKKKPVAHFIFHIVVLLASICMGIGIILFVF